MNKISKSLMALTAFGLIASPISPALAAQGEAVSSNQNASITATDPRSNTYGISTSHFTPKNDPAPNGGRIYNLYDYLVSAEEAKGTPDIFQYSQGERKAFDIFRNDNPGNFIPQDEWANYNSSYDPSIYPKQIDFSSAEIQNPVDGSWGKSFNIDGVAELSLIPEEGTDTINPDWGYSTGGATANTNNRPFVAVNPDLTFTDSLFVNYRANVINENGEIIGVVESYFVFANAERMEAYCYSPESGFTEEKRRNVWATLTHAEYFDATRYQPQASSGSGSIPYCGVDATPNTATINAGETAVIDVLADDTPLQTNNRGSLITTTDYIVNRDALAIQADEQSGSGDTFVVPNQGTWTVKDGQVEFTALPTFSGDATFYYTANTIWDTNQFHEAYRDYMTKYIGKNIEPTQITVTVNGTVEETPVEEVPEETPVEEVPEETPVEEVPEETPVEEIPEEDPIIPTPIEEETPVVEEEEPVIPIEEEETPVEIPTIVEEEPVVVPDVVEPVVVDEPTVTTANTPAVIKDGGEDTNFLAIGLVAFLGMIAAFRKKIFA